MNRAHKTQEKLLRHARLQFWSNGYSNVPVRKIALAAGVDVALISRHFGSKRGLFEATLESAFSVLDDPPQTEAELIDQFVRLYVNTPRGTSEPSAFRMLLTNAHDEDVGDLVRDLYDRGMQARLRQILGTQRGALFAAVLFGVSLVEKSLRIDGVADPADPEYEAQLRHLMNAAIAYPRKA